jgi:hypothetical protein
LLDNRGIFVVEYRSLLKEKKKTWYKKERDKIKKNKKKLNLELITQ